MTAEKLNIQPTDRSMSRITITNTMPTASMPVNALFDSSWNSDLGCRKIGLRDADEDDERDERDQHAGLIRQARAQGTRPARRTAGGREGRIVRGHAHPSGRPSPPARDRRATVRTGNDTGGTPPVKSRWGQGTLPIAKAVADGLRRAGRGTALGVHWRMWDGTRCGYEGLLTEQFGVLIPAIARWRVA